MTNAYLYISHGIMAFFKLAMFPPHFIAYLYTSHCTSNQQENVHTNYAVIITILHQLSIHLT